MVGVYDTSESQSTLQPPEVSALRDVFGSQVSLAELNGDVASGQPSRMGSPGLTPSGSGPGLLNGSSFSLGGSPAFRKHQRRKSVPARPVSAGRTGRNARSFSKLDYAARILFLFWSGCGQGQLLAYWAAAQNFESYLGRALVPSPLFSGVISGLAGVMLGVGFPLLDSYHPQRHSRGKGGEDWLSIVRAGAGLLGLTYAVTKLGGAWFFWVLASPVLWYVADGTYNGLSFSLLFTLVVISTIAWCLIPHPFDVRALTAEMVISAALFGSAICFGNLGRRLFADHFALPSAGSAIHIQNWN